MARKQADPVAEDPSPASGGNTLDMVEMMAIPGTCSIGGEIDGQPYMIDVKNNRVKVPKRYAEEFARRHSLVRA